MRYSLKNMRARSWIFSCAAALSLAFLSSAGSASGPSNPFQIGAWRAGGYTNDQTGAFTQCSASANYKSSITMLVAVNRAMAWSLAFSHPQWALTKGERIPIRLQFDAVFDAAECQIPVGPNRTGAEKQAPVRESARRR
jgi:hypothetical protein